MCVNVQLSGSVNIFWDLRALFLLFILPYYDFLFDFILFLILYACLLFE